MLNMGADVLDPHTVHERVYVDSIRPFALTLAALIERIAELIL
jgi:di/tripeptidase